MERLRLLGRRLTAPRRAVIEVLARRPEHLTVDEISTAVGGDEAHRTTIYRTVEVLEDAGVLSTLRDTNSPARFHLASLDGDGRHLHARCRVCGVVTALPADAFAEAADRTLAVTGFALDVHNSGLVGRCRSCQDEAGLPSSASSRKP